MDKSRSRGNKVEDWAKNVELIIATRNPIMYASSGEPLHGFLTIDEDFNLYWAMSPRMATVLDDEVCALRFLQQCSIPREQVIFLKR